MKIYEIGTGYTPIPAQISAATEIIIEDITKEILRHNASVEIVDIASTQRAKTDLPIIEVKVPFFKKTDVSLGILHKLKRVFYSLALAKKLKKILKETQEKVVLHFHNQYNLYFFYKTVSKKYRDKAIIAYTNHTGLWRLPWNDVERTLHKRYFQEIYGMKRADKVFVLNEETKENLIKHLEVPKERIYIINNGVNINVYKPLEEQDRQNTLKKFGLEGKKVVLQVGSVYENKGQTRSIELLSKFMRQDENLVYAYVGGIVSEEYQEEIKLLAEKLGLVKQVKYLGMISPGKELNELYNASKATIISSKYEGFTLVVLEALSAGKPVFNNSAIQNYGEGCIKVQSDDEINKLLYNQEIYLDYCEKARNTAVEKYSWEKIAKDYLIAFNDR